MSITGIKFPFSKGSTSFPDVVTGEDAIKCNILRILQERKGERPMRSETGSKMWSFIFENTGPVLNAKVDFEVRRALSIGEPRITVLRVNVTSEDDAKGDTIVYVDILYKYNIVVDSVTATFKP